jgi:tRNA (cmo5U34)-methyltransferase
MTIDEAFNASVAYYDDWMKKALPNFDDLFGTALALLPFEPQAHLEVMDLGAGTGLFAQQVLGKYPQASFVLVDLADKMLEVARGRFAEHSSQFQYVVQDYRKLEGTEQVDLVISSLSIHHLGDEDKQALFGRVYKILRKGGIFLNIDQIRGETDFLQKLYWEHWLEQVRAAGFSEQRIQEGIDRRSTYDREALLQDQLEWLKSSGFENVDCVYKNFFVGVFFGMKA